MIIKKITALMSAIIILITVGMLTTNCGKAKEHYNDIGTFNGTLVDVTSEIRGPDFFGYTAIFVNNDSWNCFTKCVYLDTRKNTINDSEKFPAGLFFSGLKKIAKNATREPANQHWYAAFFRSPENDGTMRTIVLALYYTTSDDTPSSHGSVHFKGCFYEDAKVFDDPSVNPNYLASLTVNW